MEAVQRLLYGIQVDGYYALNLDGIVPLNDLLGGVTVTLEDDFTAQDPAMAAGTTLMLQGNQAEIFVRSRTSVGDGTNASRMARQQAYLSSAMELLVEKIRANANFIDALFDGLKPYAVTSLSRGRLLNEVNRAVGYQNLGALTLPGEHRVGNEGFTEFHPDPDALMRLVLDVFYLPAD